MSGTIPTGQSRCARLLAACMPAQRIVLVQVAGPSGLDSVSVASQTPQLLSLSTGSRARRASRVSASPGSAARLRPAAGRELPVRALKGRPGKLRRRGQPVRRRQPAHNAPFTRYTVEPSCYSRRQCQYGGYANLLSRRAGRASSPGRAAAHMRARPQPAGSHSHLVSVRGLRPEERSRDLRKGHRHAVRSLTT